MAEEHIVVTVDDTQLDIAIAKAKQLMSIGTTITGTPQLQKGTAKLWSDWRAVQALNQRMLSDIPDVLRKFGEADLPGINRELRLILGQAGPIRILISDYFRLKRLQRSVGIATAEAKMLRDVITNPSLLLTLIATTILIIKAIATHFAKMKRERMLYEEFLRRERGLSKREFDLIRTVAGRRERPGAGTVQNYYWSLPEP